MAKLNLDADVMAKAAAQAAEAGYNSVDAYVARLIEDDASDPLSAADEAAVLEGLAGPGREMSAAAWAALRDEFRRRRDAAEAGAA
ncbi:MAG TPA: hypothetical protein VK324_02455 [Tepidisphaeraceae bacterium]|nr:hypothetical protein [Tepidisphaeraceae bacterium]